MVKKDVMTVDHRDGNVAIVVPASDVWFQACNRFRTKAGSRPALTKFGDLVAAAGIPTDVRSSDDRKLVQKFLNGLGNFITKDFALKSE